MLNLSSLTALLLHLIATKMKKYSLLFLLITFFQCTTISPEAEQLHEAHETAIKASYRTPEIDSTRLNVAFLIMDGVYNTELTAPYDIFQHTIFRDSIQSMNTFLVANTLNPITSFEGIPDASRLRLYQR